jgi:hypothetical protein
VIARFSRGAPRAHIISIATMFCLTGCASQIRIALEYPEAVSSGVATVSVVDARSKQEREFHLGGRPHYYRSYGDDSFVPPKVAYLRRVIEARAPPDAKVELTVSGFETIEYCDGTVERTRPLALSAVVGGMTGGKVVLPGDVPPNIKGDKFTLHLVGTVNGTPFDISEQFDYDDIRFTNFPAENSEYRQRIQRAISAAVDRLLNIKAGGSPNAASNNRWRGP